MIKQIIKPRRILERVVEYRKSDNIVKEEVVSIEKKTSKQMNKTTITVNRNNKKNNTNND
jgi:hypothetical protein